MPAEVNIYAIAAGAWIKLGVASDVQKRLRQLQTGNPEKLEVAWIVPAKNTAQAGAIETLLHDFFSSHRKSGEWFNIDIADAAYDKADSLRRVLAGETQRRESNDTSEAHFSATTTNLPLTSGRQEVDAIIDEVAKAHGVKVTAILGKGKRPQQVAARYAAMIAVHRRTGLSQRAIAAHFGCSPTMVGRALHREEHQFSPVA